MIKLKYVLIALLTSAGFGTQAQNLLRGTVSESGTKIRMASVFIKNETNKEIAVTDSKGDFEIRAATGNLIIFSSPGYTSDTLYLVDLKLKNIELVSQSIALREVTIRSSKFNPRVDYPQVYQHSKVYALSPTTWFGKQAKDARRLKHYFEREMEERTIDSAFSRTYVGSMVPLKGRELEDFMTLYRPTYTFLRSNSGQSMAVYVNDAYRKYQALPPDKRKVQRLDDIK